MSGFLSARSASEEPVEGPSGIWPGGGDFAEDGRDGLFPVAQLGLYAVVRAVQKVEIVRVFRVKRGDVVLGHAVLQKHFFYGVKDVFDAVFVKRGEGLGIGLREGHSFCDEAEEFVFE